MDFIDQNLVYKSGSNKPGLFSSIRGEEGLWYLKTGEATNAVQPERLSDDNANYKKYKNLGVIVEALGTDLFNAITPNPDEKVTVKIIKGVDDAGAEQLMVASKLVPGYKGIEELIAGGKKIEPNPEGGATMDGKPVKGLTRNFAVRYLLGDFDVANFQNIGLIDKGTHHEGQSIDFGKAFHDPELAMVHSAKNDQKRSFTEGISDAGSLPAIFIYSQLIDTDYDKLVKDHADNAQMGAGRVNPGILPPSPKEALYPLPDAVADKAELDATLKHIAKLDIEKIKEIAKPYEEYIASYIEKNNLPLTYKKGELAELIAGRIEQVRDMVKARETETDTPDLSAFKQSAPPAIESIDRPKDTAVGLGKRG